VTKYDQETALTLFYDEGKTLGEIAEIMALPRGVYDLSRWIYSTSVRERMRQEGRWKPDAADLKWHERLLR
jgi:hypothetical protein